MYGVTIKKRSTVVHPEAGMGCFDSQYFAKDEPLGHYYGTTAFRIVDKVSNAIVFGECIMAGTQPEFRNWAIRVCQQLQKL